MTDQEPLPPGIPLARGHGYLTLRAYINGDHDGVAEILSLNDPGEVALELLAVAARFALMAIGDANQLDAFLADVIDEVRRRES